MKTLKLVVIAFAIVASGAFAQTPVDAEQKAAVKELLNALNFKQMMSQLAGAMVPASRLSLPAEATTITPMPVTFVMAACSDCVQAQ